MDLCGSWRLRDESGAHDLPFDLPGDGITALQRAGLIPDPYHGRNEYGLRWVADRDWTASRSFDHPGGAAELVAEGLDTVATLRLNGDTVLEAANAFRSHRAPVTLREGGNRVEITFHAAPRKAAELQAAQPFPVPWHAGNSPIPNGNMLRKPQCDFGWDWNIALAPFGLYGALRLEEPGPRLAGLSVIQRHSPGLAQVEFDLRIEGAGAVTVSLCGQKAQAPVVQGRARATLNIEDPRLWWPTDLGEQALHELEITFGTRRETRHIGLRSIDLVTENDDAGTGFGFRVNGHTVFARGANWIPADALAGRITQGAVRDLLQSAVDANMNMIRVWGGGRYEPDWFYDLCDQMGLMVWQDFMFACNLYPSTPAFLEEVEAEVREAVLRIGHHACIALWCGDNELIGALGWFEESRRNRDRYLVSYDRLNRTVESALKAAAPGAVWWPSSPSPGPMSFGDAWHDDSAGDMHFWSVWHEGRDFDHYRDVAPRFCSEFGFQSYPSMDVIRSFAEPCDMNIASPVLESHQKNAGGNARIAETMFRYFRFPADFADFVWLSQVQQGLAIHTAVTHWRSLKPHCQGTLYWQLNDTWPVASWSSLDYGGGWKILHHMARRFYAPVTVVGVPEGDAIVLKGVNDTRKDQPMMWEALAAGPEGETRLLDSGADRLPTDRAQPLGRIPLAALNPDEILIWRWHLPCGTRGQDHHAPRPYKAQPLLPPQLSLTSRQAGDYWHLTIRAHALALFVTLEADQPGRFSDNSLTLLKDQEAQITFTPRTPGTPPRFTLRDLHSATCKAPA